MTEGLYSAKIKPEHLARKAIVYLRQSSERQVRQNKESQQLQYAMAERVRALGWKQVEIINSDLGSSAGIAAARREGFERVLSSVALGEVGIVGSREVSRLSRTDKDWCRLLEVCQIFGTLIADEQQVYDLNYLDDQKMIFRTAMEEIVVRTDADKKTLEFTIHWKGGAHTQLTMERPRSATETATPVEALEIIRRMAVRHGDDQIASVLNRLGHSTGKGKRWNQDGVAAARRNHSIPGQKRALPDPDRVSLSEAARICGVSHWTIERLVDAGLLRRAQNTPRAPWEIRRGDLNAEPVRSIVERLLRTGKLMLHGGCADNQPPLFAENEGDDNAGHHE